MAQVQHPALHTLSPPDVPGHMELDPCASTSISEPVVWQASSPCVAATLNEVLPCSNWTSTVNEVIMLIVLLLLKMGQYQ